MRTWSTSDGLVLTLPSMTSPVVPSMRDPVAFLERPALDGHRPLAVVDDERAAAGDADLAHLPGDQGRVGGHPAAGRQDALGGVHALDVLGRGLDAGQDDLLAPLRPGLGVRGVEDDAAGGGAGAGVQALGQEAAALDGGVLLGRGRRSGRRSWLSWSGSMRARASFVADELLADHVHGDPDGGEGGALADAALEHVELALLDGELDVHHVRVVLLEGVADLLELGVGLRDRPSASSAIGSGVRMPATTSSPWAFIRYSP